MGSAASKSAEPVRAQTTGDVAQAAAGEEARGRPRARSRGRARAEAEAAGLGVASAPTPSAASAPPAAAPRGKGSPWAVPGKSEGAAEKSARKAATAAFAIFADRPKEWPPRESTGAAAQFDGTLLAHVHRVEQHLVEMVAQGKQCLQVKYSSPCADPGSMQGTVDSGAGSVYAFSPFALVRRAQRRRIPCPDCADEGCTPRATAVWSKPRFVFEMSRRSVLVGSQLRAACSNRKFFSTSEQYLAKLESSFPALRSCLRVTVYTGSVWSHEVVDTCLALARCTSVGFSAVAKVLAEVRGAYMTRYSTHVATAYREECELSRAAGRAPPPVPTPPVSLHDLRYGEAPGSSTAAAQRGPRARKVRGSPALAKLASAVTSTRKAQYDATALLLLHSELVKSLQAERAAAAAAAAAGVAAEAASESSAQSPARCADDVEASIRVAMPKLTEARAQHCRATAAHTAAVAAFKVRGATEKGSLGSGGALFPASGGASADELRAHALRVRGASLLAVRPEHDSSRTVKPRALCERTVRRVVMHSLSDAHTLHQLHFDVLDVRIVKGDETFATAAKIIDSLMVGGKRKSVHLHTCLLLITNMHNQVLAARYSELRTHAQLKKVFTLIAERAERHGVKIVGMASDGCPTRSGWADAQGAAANMQKRADLFHIQQLVVRDMNMDAPGAAAARSRLRDCFITVAVVEGFPVEVLRSAPDMAAKLSTFLQDLPTFEGGDEYQAACTKVVAPHIAASGRAVERRVASVLGRRHGAAEHDSAEGEQRASKLVRTPSGRAPAPKARAGWQYKLAKSSTEQKRNRPVFPRPQLTVNTLLRLIAHANCVQEFADASHYVVFDAYTGAFFLRPTRGSSRQECLHRNEPRLQHSSMTRHLFVLAQWFYWNIERGADAFINPRFATSNVMLLVQHWQALDQIGSGVALRKAAACGDRSMPRDQFMYFCSDSFLRRLVELRRDSAADPGAFLTGRCSGVVGVAVSDPREVTAADHATLAKMWGGSTLWSPVPPILALAEARGGGAGGGGGGGGGGRVHSMVGLANMLNACAEPRATSRAKPVPLYAQTGQQLLNNADLGNSIFDVTVVEERLLRVLVHGGVRLSTMMQLVVSWHIAWSVLRQPPLCVAMPSFDPDRIARIAFEVSLRDARSLERSCRRSHDASAQCHMLLAQHMRAMDLGLRRVGVFVPGLSARGVPAAAVPRTTAESKVPEINLVQLRLSRVQHNVEMTLGTVRCKECSHPINSFFHEYEKTTDPITGKRSGSRTCKFDSAMAGADVAARAVYSHVLGAEGVATLSSVAECLVAIGFEASVVHRELALRQSALDLTQGEAAVEAAVEEDGEEAGAPRPRAKSWRHSTWTTFEERLLQHAASAASNSYESLQGHWRLVVLCYVRDEKLRARLLSLSRHSVTSKAHRLRVCPSSVPLADVPAAPARTSPAHGSAGAAAAAAATGPVLSQRELVLRRVGAHQSRQQLLAIFEQTAVSRTPFAHAVQRAVCDVAREARVAAGVPHAVACTIVVSSTTAKAPGEYMEGGATGKLGQSRWEQASLFLASAWRAGITVRSSQPTLAQFALSPTAQNRWVPLHSAVFLYLVLLGPGAVTWSALQLPTGPFLKVCQKIASHPVTDRLTPVVLTAAEKKLLATGMASVTRKLKKQRKCGSW